jgi:7,8-dihydropterin-6-yl-methyl-4-(beta-D-ribofuranosyl)aminobenzene 5'-phosphate synthase
MPHPLKELERIEITCLMDNYVDALAEDGCRVMHRPALVKKAADGRKVLTASPLAEHGFSAHVLLADDHAEAPLLFDFGCSEQGVLYNADLLSLDLSPVRCLVLSHGHLDHVGGLKTVMERLAGQPLELILHPAALRSNRHVRTRSGERIFFPPFSLDPLMRTGLVARKTTRPLLLFDGKALFLGEIPRRCPFETGMSHAFYEENGMGKNDGIEDDSALVFHLRGRGLVILTGCAHAGIINTITYAREITGIERIHAVMGGFHLSGGCATATAPTIAALKKIAPDYVIPAHCTGRAAGLAIEQAMPGQFLLNMSGTRFTFSGYTLDSGDV